jgi:hypothetical protein
MGLFYAAILLGTAALSWWISGYDPRLTGENKADDLSRRILRCGLTLLLMAAGIVEVASDPRFAGATAITIAIPMVMLWLNCTSEALAQGFHSLIDSPSDSPGSDPKKLAADLDRLAKLSNRGQIYEALQLCAELLIKGEASRLAMETMCFRLYSQMFADESLLASPRLSPVCQLCEIGQFTEAESQLTQILEQEPENLLAFFMLLRMYARDIQQPESARALIQSLERRPNQTPMFPPPMFSAYADFQIKEWLDSSSRDVKSDVGIESLLAGRLIK